MAQVHSIPRLSILKTRRFFHMHGCPLISERKPSAVESIGIHKPLFNSFYINGFPAPTGWLIMGLRVHPTSARLYVNDGTTPRLTITPQDISFLVDPITLGGGDMPFTGEIGEVLVWNVPISDALFATTLQNLRQKWGI